MTESISKVMDNMSSGEFGTRGELFVVGQLVLMLSILYGDIPLFGDTLKFLFGPGMFVLGGVVAGLGVKELGSNISPFPKVSDNTDLVTDGIFGEVRHPIYAGLLYACLGISVWSGSATRLLLTAALWYLLTKKSDFEERTLVEKFPAYEDYLLEVEGKFIPERLLKSMPWVDKD
jgi:protein-S-isoprenylcysteine O-methyltransferase Ste14